LQILVLYENKCIIKTKHFQKRTQVRCIFFWPTYRFHNKQERIQGEDDWGDRPLKLTNLTLLTMIL